MANNDVYMKNVVGSSDMSQAQMRAEYMNTGSPGADKENANPKKRDRDVPSAAFAQPTAKPKPTPKGGAAAAAGKKHGKGKSSKKQLSIEELKGKDDAEMVELEEEGAEEEDLAEEEVAEEDQLEGDHNLGYPRSSLGSLASASVTALEEESALSQSLMSPNARRSGARQFADLPVVSPSITVSEPRVLAEIDQNTNSVSASYESSVASAQKQFRGYVGSGSGQKHFNAHNANNGRGRARGREARRTTQAQIQGQGYAHEYMPQAAIDVAAVPGVTGRGSALLSAHFEGNHRTTPADSAQDASPGSGSGAKLRSTSAPAHVIEGIHGTVHIHENMLDIDAVEMLEVDSLDGDADAAVDVEYLHGDSTTFEQSGAEREQSGAEPENTQHGDSENLLNQLLATATGGWRAATPEERDAEKQKRLQD